MLQCKTSNAAMQTRRLLLASGMHKLFFDDGDSDLAVASKETTEGKIMSKTASVALAPSTSLFGRLVAAFDRLLMINAHIAVRNGDLPRFGL
jgi:hypothetical protein